MADSLTHLAVGYLGGKATPDGPTRVLFYLGNLLPDIVFKAIYYITLTSTWYCEPSHSPIMLVLICYLMAHLFEERMRKRAFSALLLGSFCHIFVDAFKTYLGEGVILWAFPFSFDRFEFGLLKPYQTIYLMGAGLIVIVLTEGTIRLWRRKKVEVHAR